MRARRYLLVPMTPQRPGPPAATHPANLVALARGIKASVEKMSGIVDVAEASAKKSASRFSGAAKAVNATAAASHATAAASHVDGTRADAGEVAFPLTPQRPGVGIAAAAAAEAGAEMSARMAAIASTVRIADQ